MFINTLISSYIYYYANCMPPSIKLIFHSLMNENVHCSNCCNLINVVFALQKIISSSHDVPTFFHDLHLCNHQFVKINILGSRYVKKEM